jgi:8-oxo-dGTP diphosphatase
VTADAAADGAVSAGAGRARVPVLATLVYVRDGDRTLMLHRNARPDDTHYGKWNGLGGKLEPGESPDACMRREVREESGLTVERAEFKGLLTFPDFDGRADWYAFVYLVTRTSGAVGADPPEGSLRWVPTSEVADLPLWEGDRVFLPWLDRPGVFSGVFRYVAGRLADHEVTFYGGPER